jgi:hypothetical protein
MLFVGEGELCHGFPQGMEELRLALLGFRLLYTSEGECAMKEVVADASPVFSFLDGYLKTNYNF